MNTGEKRGGLKLESRKRECASNKLFFVVDNPE